MASFTSFLKRLFGSRKPTTPDDGSSGQTLTTEQAAPALQGKELLESRPEQQEIEHQLSQWRGKVLLEFRDFMIAVPQGGSVCSVCSHPTYSEANNDGQIIMSEESQGDADLLKKAGKLFVLAAATSCKNCSSHLCWNCIITVGLGSCPKCHQTVDEHPWHGRHSLELLTEEQKLQVIQAVLIARQDGDKGERAIEMAARRLAADGWDDVDTYFGKRHAQGINQMLNDGRLNEADFRSLLEGDSKENRRRIVTVPLAKGESVRVVAGTAYVEDDGGLQLRVMAEFEDGQVRCVTKNAFGEIFVAAINKKG